VGVTPQKGPRSGSGASRGDALATAGRADDADAAQSTHSAAVWGSGGADGRSWPEPTAATWTSGAGSSCGSGPATTVTMESTAGSSSPLRASGRVGGRVGITALPARGPHGSVSPR
jgi:hypothetical protein